MSGPVSRTMAAVRQHPLIFGLGLAHLPLVGIYLITLWRREHYQFFPFAVAAFVVLTLSRADWTSLKLTRIGRFLIVLDIVLLATGTFINKSWFVYLGACCFSVAVCSSMYEREFRHRLTYLTVLPIMILRPPGASDFTFIQWLQVRTTRVASEVLHSLGYLHLRNGNIIEFPGKEFMVAEACSGVQSLFTIVFLAAMIVCVRRRPILHGALLIISGVALAAALNTVRICTIAIVWRAFEIDLSAGWQHDMVGYAALLIAAGLLLSADALLFFFMASFQDFPHGPLATVYRNPFTSLWNYFLDIPVRALRNTEWPPASTAVILTALLAGAGIATAQCFNIVQSEKNLFTAQTESRPDIVTEDTLPENLSGYRIVSFDRNIREASSFEGHYSCTWHLTDESNRNAVVSFDHPFRTWHPLENCYVARGWTVTSRALVASENEDWPSTIVNLHDPARRTYGIIVYSLFYEDGIPFQAPDPNDLLSTMLTPLTDDRSGVLGYQVQAHFESTTIPGDERIDELLKLHHETRGIFHQAVSEPQGGAE